MAESMIDFETVIENFKDKKVLVIGDVMVDKYIVGKVKRVSPEAPVPVLHKSHENLSLGGAGNAVMNLANLGAKVYIMAAVGNDSAGHWIINEMKRIGADTSFIITCSDRPTTQKIRLVNEQYHQLARLDVEETGKIDSSIVSPVADNVKNWLKEFDAVLISDYAKGMIGGYISNIISTARSWNKPVVVDGKPSNVSLFKGCTLITPNKKEASEMSGIKLEDKSSVIEAAEKISRKLGCSVLITLGGEGMALWHGGKLEHLKAHAKTNEEVIDICGAGDTVSAVMTLSLAEGLSLRDGIYLSNLAAYLVVRKKGVVSVDPHELKQYIPERVSALLEEGIKVNRKLIESELKTIKKFSELLIETYHRRGKVLVFGNGGSASDAQHLVGELVGRFKAERKGLPAIALNAETATLTAVANDYGYENVFSRQVEALISEGDLAVGITTSGNSPNVIKALEAAKKAGAVTVGLTGKNGGRIKDLVDLCIKVPSDNTPRVQEAHGIIIHIVCELLDESIAESGKDNKSDDISCIKRDKE